MWFGFLLIISLDINTLFGNCPEISDQSGFWRFSVCDLFQREMALSPQIDFLYKILERFNLKGQISKMAKFKRDFHQNLAQNRSKTFPKLPISKTFQLNNQNFSRKSKPATFKVLSIAFPFDNRLLKCQSTP